MARNRRGRGEGSIYKRADGRWTSVITVGIDENGRQIRHQVYGKTKTEVRDKLTELQHRSSSGLLVKPERTTLAEYLNDWLDGREEAEQIRPSTASDYRYTITRHIVPHIGRVRMSELNPATVNTFYRRLVTVECSSGNRVKVHRVLRKSFNDAVKLGLLSLNPCQRVETPKHVTKEGQSLSPEQVTAFLNAARNDTFYPLYVVAISTGCRQGELLELRWTDIDFEKGTLSITRALVDLNGKRIVGPPKSRKGVRTIRLSNVTLEAFQTQRTRLMRDGLAGCELVFPDRKGSWLRRQTIHRSYGSILKRAGIDPSFRFHDLRHSMATLLLASDVDVKTVSERLGHSRIQVTLDLYVHGTDAGQQKAADAMDSMLKAV